MLRSSMVSSLVRMPEDRLRRIDFSLSQVLGLQPDLEDRLQSVTGFGLQPDREYRLQSVTGLGALARRRFLTDWLKPILLRQTKVYPPN